MKTLLFAIGIIFLFAVEVLKVYLIMPFPGSQESSAVQLAYFLHTNAWWLRIVGLALVLPFVLHVYRTKRLFGKIAITLPLLLYALVFYAGNFRFLADKIFIIPRTKQMLPAAANKVPPEKLVIGVEYKGEARAYPIEVIGYHHQVLDTIAGDPLLITYCTVCRTGRVYSPVVNGTAERFRLVGMDRFNAMLEDATTGSWWQQATGEAVAGKLAGRQLTDVPSMQMTLGTWTEHYPATRILQPDPEFRNRYEHLQGFDEGTIESSLEKRDSASWRMKSWVVGVVSPQRAVAFDWNILAQKKILIDRDIMVMLEKDGASFRAFSTVVDGTPQVFEWNSDQSLLTETSTGCTWNVAGVCIEGTHTGKYLTQLQASQEFWHSWQTFHSGTSLYPAE
ncbi:MAG: DUF3179 domain-containing protein [Ignavibacteriae bacterium]|nr:DUF3179 domain-containing protein [Ignavibacteria bacterium]MBI3364570.1 DUF3179 domain-containing protein [Ignavibacteriota bacterium]